MKCPNCGGPSSVYDSRDHGEILRRRKCKNCSHRFATKEITRTKLMALEARSLGKDHPDKLQIRKAIKMLQEIASK